MTPEVIAQLIAEFSAQGIHRTGWPADDAASHWISQWLGRQEIKARIEDFQVGILQSRNAYVEINRQQIHGVPLYDGGSTSATRVRARDCSAGSRAC